MPLLPILPATALTGRRRGAGGEDQRLAAVRSLGLLDSGRDERFDRIVRLAAALFDIPVAAIVLLDADRLYVKAVTGADETSLPREASICTTVVERGEPIVVPDLAADERFADHLLLRGAGRRFYAGVPLRSPDGHAVGTLCLIDSRPRELPADRLSALADLGAIAESELSVRALAHEVRTPVAAILGYAEELLESGLDGEAHDAVTAVARNARRLHGLAARLRGVQAGGVNR